MFQPVPYFMLVYLAVKGSLDALATAKPVHCRWAVHKSVVVTDHCHQIANINHITISQTDFDSGKTLFKIPRLT